jgi:hypothetical protein
MTVTSPESVAAAAIAFDAACPLDSNGVGLALDESVRQIDPTSGRLHIRTSPISKADINPYYGREIHNACKLGLKDDRIYHLLRDPEELQKVPRLSRASL